MNIYGDYGDEDILRAIHGKFPLMVVVNRRRPDIDVHEWARQNFGHQADWKTHLEPHSGDEYFFNPEAFYDTYDHMFFFREGTHKVIEFKLLFG